MMQVLYVLLTIIFVLFLLAHPGPTLVMLGLLGLLLTGFKLIERALYHR